MDLQKAAAVANIGSFVLAIFLWYGQHPSTTSELIMTPALGIFLAVLLLAGYLNFSAFRMASSASGNVRKSSQQLLQALSLREQVAKLGNDLFAFLRDIGPEPKEPAGGFKNVDEKIRHTTQLAQTYHQRVRQGYLSRFKDRVIKISQELAIEGIDTRELQDCDIELPETTKSASVKKIAETMFLMASKLDIKEASKGT
jgi:hypothetical protein